MFYDLGECLCLRHWKHLCSWERITQKNLHSIKNTWKDLTFKPMFDIYEQLIVEQSDQFFGVSQISWEDSPWKQVSLVNDEEVNQSLACKGFMYSQILCHVLER